MTASDSDDEAITLSSHALAALAEFNAERDAHQERFEKLKAQAEDDAMPRESATGPLSMEAFAEDWNESQFWYSDEAARLLARELLDGATSATTICVVSAPSVFVALKNLLREARESGAETTWQGEPELVLLEHDDRFGIFGEFVFYDFQQPLKLPGRLKGRMDRVICDPPFLSEDCQTKAAMTVRWLMKPPLTNSDSKSRLILCTGERMQRIVLKLYRAMGLRTTTYEPVHARGLSNEFLCYANFEGSEWGWKEAPADEAEV